MTYDAIVVGGGIMGSSTAAQLAYRGLKVVLLEARAGLCLEASGTNAGGLACQNQKAELIPYALKATEMWRGRTPPFLFDLDYTRTGSLLLAFTDEDCELLCARARARVAHGAPIEILSGNAARDLEPQLSPEVAMASYCALDGHVDSLNTGRAFERILRDLGAKVRTSSPVERIYPGDDIHEVEVAGERITAKRIVVAAGAWVAPLLKEFGITVELILRINQVIITERVPWKVRRYVSIAAGNLSVKQLEVGTITIGGAWQGRGGLEPRSETIDHDNLIGNLRLAALVVPRLKTVRMVRAWTGFDIRNEPFDPLIGRIPDHRNAYLIGGVFSGYHLGICLGSLMGDAIAGHATDLPIPPGATAEPMP